MKIADIIVQRVQSGMRKKTEKKRKQRKRNVGGAFHQSVIMRNHHFDLKVMTMEYSYTILSGNMWPKTFNFSYIYQIGIAT